MYALCTGPGARETPHICTAEHGSAHVVRPRERTADSGRRRDSRETQTGRRKVVQGTRGESETRGTLKSLKTLRASRTCRSLSSRCGLWLCATRGWRRLDGPYTRLDGSRAPPGIVLHAYSFELTIKKCQVANCIHLCHVSGSGSSLPRQAGIVAQSVAIGYALCAAHEMR